MQVAWILVYHSKAPERKLVGLAEGWKGLGENSSDVLNVCILSNFFFPETRAVTAHWFL